VFTSTVRVLSEFLIFFIVTIQSEHEVMSVLYLGVCVLYIHIYCLWKVDVFVFLAFGEQIKSRLCAHDRAQCLLSRLYYCLNGRRNIRGHVTNRRRSRNGSESSRFFTSFSDGQAHSTNTHVYPCAFLPSPPLSSPLSK